MRQQLGVDRNMQSSTGGVVSVSHPAAARVGRDVLARGGNAMDAAIAIQFSLNVVEPYMSGIGGGTYAIYYDAASGEITTLDGRESAGMDVEPQRYCDLRQSMSSFDATTHGLTVGVPGTVKLMQHAAQKFGTLDLSGLIQYAVHQAEVGIPINAATQRYARRGLDRILKSESARKVFIPNGKLLQQHDLLVQTDLARTLRSLQENGLDSFYTGEIADGLVCEVRAAGGYLTKSDLMSYQIRDIPSITAHVFGYDVVSMGGSTSGGIALLQILKLMERFDFNGNSPNSTEYLHRLIEVMHLVYADRVQHIGDPEFFDIPVKRLLDDEYLSSRLALLSDERSVISIDPGLIGGPEVSPGNQHVREELNTETTHFSVVDVWGNMVAFTTSIGQVYGSGIMPTGYGFLLNSTGGGFDSSLGGPNEIAPGKRPLSSITPTMILEDGRPVAALGSPGATTIIGSVAQTILNLVGFGMSIEDAILMPRVHSSSNPRVEWESGIDAETRIGLIAKGHAVESRPQNNIGDVHAVLRDWNSGLQYGGTDDAREGAVLGVDGVDITLSPTQLITGSSEPPYTLRIDGTSIPLAGSQLLMSERECYAARAVLLRLLDLNPEELELDRFVCCVKGESLLPVGAVCKSSGMKTDWDEQNMVLSVTTNRVRPLPNEVQRKYQNEALTVTR